MRKTLLFFIITSCLTNFLFGQETKIDKANFIESKRNAISLSLLGVTPIIGFTYERIIKTQTTFEIGVGLVSAGLGFRYYFTEIQDRRLLFNAGILGMVSPFFGDCEFCFGGKGFATYIPLGLSYNQNALNLSLDIGGGTSFDNPPNAFLWYGNLKIGVRF